MNIVFLLLELVTGVCLAFYGLYLFWLSYHYLFGKQNIGPPASSLYMVSVIVPARNEQAHIQDCIKGILAQNYPTTQFEVIVVDDHSTDNTADIVRAMMGEKINLKFIQLEGAGGKKRALTAGIESSKGDLIVTTDADCNYGDEWLVAMLTYFDADTGLVSGPVELDPNGRLFGYFQHLEFMGLIAVGAASIKSHHPNMCNGANLAFRKQAWLEVGGYDSHADVPSGDDELFMHALFQQGKWKIRFAEDSRAIVKTLAQPDWKAFRNQRIRWVSKSRKYERKSVTLVLALSYIGFLFFPVALIHSVLDPDALFLLMAGFLLKILAELSLLVQAASFFHKLRYLVFLIPEQFLHIPYVLWVGIRGNFGHYLWKDREISFDAGISE